MKAIPYDQAPSLTGVDLYGAAGDEDLTHSDLDDAIEEILDQWSDEHLREGVLTITAWRRRAMDGWGSARAEAVALLERLDEDDEYGIGPESKPTQPWPALIAAFEEVIAEVRRTHKPHWCEEVGEIEVDVPAWVKERRPDWLAARGVSA